jgi:uncharacterized protein with ATP-grasp and redox domains
MLPPRLPLPDHLRGNEAGTFTEDSVVRRLPEIARRVIAENDLDTHRTQRVENLATEIGSGVITRLDEPEAADAAAWVEYVAPYEGQRWVDVPWFFVETYFYRRVLAASGYSQPGPRRGVDPFAVQKQTALDGAIELAWRLAESLGDVPTLLGASLWANRVDLSLWPAGGDDADDRTKSVVGFDGANRLLADDTEEASVLLQQPEALVHLILDNSGAELVADLALVADILNRGGRVTIHAKPHPTFVSDVTLLDLETTIERLVSEPDAVGRLGRTLRQAQETGAIQATVHPFWVSPLPFWKCPEDLVDTLSAADVVISKGDANYRRLLGDLHWDPTTPFTDIVRPLQPLVALRTSKSMVGAGISSEMVATATAADPDWMTSGEWGMIQVAAEIL